MIVLTRPIADAQSFAENLEGEGLQTLIEPMLDIKPIVHDMPDVSAYQGLVFTSANAVRLYEGSFDLPVFAVGDKTADAVRSKVKNIPGTLKKNNHSSPHLILHNSRGGGEELVKLLCHEFERCHKGQETKDKSKPYLHVRGAHVAQDLASALSDNGIRLDQLIVYDSVQSEGFSEKFIARLKRNEISVITFFSKRTAENFMRLAEKHNVIGYLSSIKALSISKTVLECVQPVYWKETYKALHPNGKSMLDKLKRVCY